MKYPISEYATLVFDCDGVILNSNRVKTQAFYQSALSYGQIAANALVDHHIAHGGISRYQKFDFFLKNIVPIAAPNVQGPDFDSLLESYAKLVRGGLLNCEVAVGLPQLREITSVARWIIVSGGDQAELREVFFRRGLAKLFDGGIFGSPDTKDEIIDRELGNGAMSYPALFIGDSYYDYQAAKRGQLDFLFLTNWTEVKDCYAWCAENKISSAFDLKELLN